MTAYTAGIEVAAEWSHSAECDTTNIRPHAILSKAASRA